MHLDARNKASGRREGDRQPRDSGRDGAGGTGPHALDQVETELGVAGEGVRRVGCTDGSARESPYFLNSLSNARRIAPDFLGAE